MRNWILAARALAPDMPAEAAERIAAPLDALEAAFRPLTLSLPPETEPAVLFSLPVEEER